MIVIADAASDRALLETLGADVVIARGTDLQNASEISSAGVDGLADGALLNEKAIPAVRDGGAFTAIRGFLKVSLSGKSDLPKPG